MMLGFLRGIVNSDMIIDSVYYALDTLEWFDGVLQLFDAIAATSKVVDIPVFYASVTCSGTDSFTGGVSCLRMTGNLPTESAQFRTLFGGVRLNPNRPCDLKKAIHFERNEWMALENHQCIPFQTLRLLRPWPYRSFPSSTNPLQREDDVHPLELHTLKTILIGSAGVEYIFNGSERAIVLPWELIRYSVGKHKPVKPIKRQTVLITPNPGLAEGGEHG